MSTTEIILLVVLVASWTLVVVEGRLLYLLIRQHGQVLLSQEQLRSTLADHEMTLRSLREPTPQPGPPAVPAPFASGPQPLPIGRPAPAFALPDLTGKVRSLADYAGRPALLVFFNPDCGFCVQLAPKLSELTTSGLQLIVVSRGDSELHLRLAEEYAWHADVLLETGWEIATAYGTNATPTAYLIDAHGNIASTLAVGADAIWELAKIVPKDDQKSLTLETIKAKERAVAETAERSGLRIRESRLNREGLTAGTIAPLFRLPSLQSIYRGLEDFRGRRILLVFSDPACTPCQALAPELQHLHETHSREGLQVLMISRGDSALNHQKAGQLGLTFPVLLQRGWDVSKDYGIFATPVAYVVDERGVLMSNVAIGAESILELAESHWLVERSILRT